MILDRRGFLAGLGLVPGSALLNWPTPEEPEPVPELQAATVAFDGAHQAGVDTPRQGLARLVALDLVDGADRPALRRMLSLLTDDARRLTAGDPVPGDLAAELGRAPANLTVTLGLGPGFLEAAGRAGQRPAWLAPLPEYPGDRIDPARSGGDLLLQLCADDPMTLAHATRLLLRDATAARLRWSADGAIPDARGRAAGEPPRGHSGHLLGVGNPRGEEELDRLVWIDSGPDWLRGGTAMVVRRIELDLPAWSRLDRPARERAVGRRLADGAPPDAGVSPLAHVARAAAPRQDPGRRLLRRSYPFEELNPGDPAAGPGAAGPDRAGLLFIAFQRDPLAQFDPIRRRLARADLFGGYATATASAVFAVPRGTRPGEDWAADLLAD